MKEKVRCLVRPVVKDLNKYISNYCLAHSDMLDAQENYQRIRCTRTILQYTEAEAKFKKARRALKAKLPAFATMKEVLGDHMSMIQESYLDTPDDE